MPCAVRCTTWMFWAFFTIRVSNEQCQGMLTGPGTTGWRLAMLLNTSNIQRWRDCIQNAHREHTWPAALHCRWYYLKSARSLHQRCDKGNFSGLITAERWILVSRNGFGSWVYWNSCSAGEPGFLTVYTESSFRKLSIFKMRKSVFTWLSLFLNHSNYQLWLLMPGLKVRQSIMSNGSIY